MFSPGTYIARRREAAGLSIEDVAALVHTAPRLGEVDRVAWLRRIERDVAALSPDVCASLARAFPLSGDVLGWLIDARSYGGGAGPMPRVCAVCACSEYDPCFDPETHRTCAWSDQPGDVSLCTACTATAASTASKDHEVAQ